MGKRRKRVAGPGLLEAFLKKHGLNYHKAAVALGLNHPTVWQWVRERTRPRPHLRKRLATWTGNEVPESSWAAAGETVEIAPFKANGTDE